MHTHLALELPQLYAYPPSARTARHTNSNSTCTRLSFYTVPPTEFRWRHRSKTAIYCSPQRNRRSAPHLAHTNHSSNTLSIKENPFPSPNLTFPKFSSNFHRNKSLGSFDFPNSSYIPTKSHNMRCPASFCDRTSDIAMFMSWV
jgi:hypothetical protein